MIFLIAHLDYFYLWPCLAWTVDIMNYGNPVITGLKPAINNNTGNISRLLKPLRIILGIFLVC